MKKLLIAACLFYSGVSFAQINLEHTYTTTVSEAQTAPSTWNYYTADASNINVYDITHALIMNVPTPTIGGFKYSGIRYLSKNLYNSSGLWTWEIDYLNTTTKPWEYLMTVYDQTGTQLFREDSCFGGGVFNTSSGTKMICNLYGVTKGYYGGKVYSLSGTLYATAPEVSNNNNNYTLTNPYPNPSNDLIHLAYSLPAGSDKAEMVITNISGQAIKTCNVGIAFNDLIFDTKQYPAGEYLYYIHTNNYTSPASKFIISK